MSDLTLAQAAGLGARKIRLDAGTTLAHVAKTARFYGLPWTSGKVGDFESGRVSPTLPTLFAVAATLSDACNRPVALTDLFQGDDAIAINSEISVHTSRLREVLGGAPVQWEARDEIADAFARADEIVQLPATLRPIDVTKWRTVRLDYSEGDRRMANSLGIDEAVAIAAMAKLWGRTFVAERDARAGREASAQKKGRVARDLKSEIEEALDGND